MLRHETGETNPRTAGWYADLLSTRQARSKANPGNLTENPKAGERGEVLGDWVYFRSASGALYRRPRWVTADVRLAEFIAPQAKAEFALRLARLEAGLPERGN
jgi:hypothetical protein